MVSLDFGPQMKAMVPEDSRYGPTGKREQKGGFVDREEVKNSGSENRVYYTDIWVPNQAVGGEYIPIGRGEIATI